MIGGSAVFKDRIWILGGGTYDTPATPKRNFYNDVWSSPDGVALGEGHRGRALGAAPVPRRRRVRRPAVGAGGLEREESQRRLVLRGRENLVRGPGHARGRRATPPSVFVYQDALWMVAGNNMTPDAWKLTRTAGK